MLVRYMCKFMRGVMCLWLWVRRGIICLCHGLGWLFICLTGECMSLYEKLCVCGCVYVYMYVWGMCLWVRGIYMCISRRWLGVCGGSYVWMYRMLLCLSVRDIYVWGYFLYVKNYYMQTYEGQLCVHMWKVILYVWGVLKCMRCGYS